MNARDFGDRTPEQLKWTRDTCPDKAKRHTPAPDGYLSRHAWFEWKAKAHYQVQCPTCGLWTIWKRKSKAGVSP